VGGCEAADGGKEGEEEVFSDEAPGEQADDGADLAADDADRSPERRARDGAEQEKDDLVAVEA
jgi:hypothetical protein